MNESKRPSVDEKPEKTKAAAVKTIGPLTSGGDCAGLRRAVKG